MSWWSTAPRQWASVWKDFPYEAALTTSRLGAILPHEKSGRSPDFDAEKLLVCQRTRHQTMPLKWEFPGGKIEDGEQPATRLS